MLYSLWLQPKHTPTLIISCWSLVCVTTPVTLTSQNSSSRVLFKNYAFLEDRLRMADHHSLLLVSIFLNSVFSRHNMRMAAKAWLWWCPFIRQRHKYGLNVFSLREFWNMGLVFRVHLERCIFSEIFMNVTSITVLKLRRNSKTW